MYDSNSSPCHLSSSPPHDITKPNQISSNILSPQTIVAVNPFAAARSATNFYQPSAFLPERWLDPVATSSSSPFASDNRDASKHFGTGARDCLGQGIAWAEMRLVLASLAWAFDIEAVRAVEWTQRSHIFSGGRTRLRSCCAGG